MLAVFLEQIEMVEHADHDLGVGEILGEAFVGNVIEGFAAGFTDEGEVLGLEGGDGAGLKGGVIRDAVDGRLSATAWASCCCVTFFSRIS